MTAPLVADAWLVVVLIAIGLMPVFMYRWAKNAVKDANATPEGIRPDLAEKVRPDSWLEDLSELGLLPSADGTFTGKVDGSTVEVRRAMGADGFEQMTIRVSGELPLDFAFWPRATRPDEGRIGDRGFDAVVAIGRSVSSALGILDAPARAAVMKAVGGDWTFVMGAWKIQRSYAPGRLGSLVREGVALAAHTRVGAEEQMRRLLDRVRGERDGEARRLALTALLARWRGSNACEEALDLSLSDRDVEVRLLGATERMHVATLSALARNSDILSMHRARALDVVLRARQPEPLAAILETLAREYRERPMAMMLAKGLAEALGVAPGEKGEAKLVALLVDDHEEVRLAAIGALGTVGSVDAVPALVRLRDGKASTESRRANAAILAIQSRAKGAEAGALALAETGGELALKDD